MQKRSLTIIFLMILCTICSADQKVIQGTWMIDIDRTNEYVRNSPKYNAEDAVNLPGDLQLLKGLLTIRITSNKIVTMRGDQQQEMIYEVASIKDDQVIGKAAFGGKEFTVTFNLMSNDRLNMESTATDDMDYIVWTRSP